MNRYFIFLFLCLSLPVLAEDDFSVQKTGVDVSVQQVDEAEEVFEENILDEDEKDDMKYFRVRNAAQASPKKMHNISVNKAYKSLEKEKLRFEKLKNRELWLLKDESEVLEYTSK